MKPITRITIVICALGVVAAALCISYTPSFTAEIHDSAGNPLPGTFILYNYAGDVFAPCSIQYYRGGSILETDENGVFTIPGLLHAHLPFPLETRAKSWILIVYSPVTHSFASEVDFMNEHHQRTLHKITLLDKSKTPKDWLNGLYSTLFEFETLRLAHINGTDGIKAPRQTKQRFIAMLRAEFARFAAEYPGTTYLDTYQFKDSAGLERYEQELEGVAPR